MFEVSLWTCGLSHKEVFPLFFTAWGGGGGAGAKRPWSSLCHHSITPRWTCHSRWLPSSRRKDTPRHTRVYYPSHVTPPCITPHHTLHLATLPCITPHHTTQYTTPRYFQLRHITEHMKPRHCIALHHVSLRHSTQYITSWDVILYYPSLISRTVSVDVKHHVYLLYCIISLNTALRNTVLHHAALLYVKLYHIRQYLHTSHYIIT